MTLLPAPAKSQAGTLPLQYVHAVFTTLAYHLHEPLPEPLHDIGFEIFPSLGESNAWVTEMLVYTGGRACLLNAGAARSGGGK